MDLIKKTFIKDYKNTQDPKVRFKYGLFATIFGLVSNIILFGLKLAIGIIGTSITIVADAINNLSDAGSSIVSLLGFKLSSKPADTKHPFGHARYEYVTALIVALLVVSIGFSLMTSSIEKCIHPEIPTITYWTYIVLAISIVMKFFQMLLYYNFGKSINSNSLKASGDDSRNDAIATTAVLISTIIIQQTGVNIDPYMGIAVSLFIIISSLMMVKETMDPLIGIKPDKELVETIKNKIMSYEGVIGMHDLVIHNYGEGVCFVICHVEVPANQDVLKSHDLIDNIEKDFRNDLNIVLNIHMDPVDTDDEELKLLQEEIKKIIFEMDESLSLHDFRIVRGETHHNILFDVVIPYECKINENDIISTLEEHYKEHVPKYYFVINVDRNFVL